MKPPIKRPIPLAEKTKAGIALEQARPIRWGQPKICRHFVESFQRSTP